ncbi:type VII secretion protein EssC [Evansella cellulosilytica]|uniref:FHA domain containing protein n=1 Tax=Evansella cellulosilytica (strain ATCC 21833 / DSM 2522 / FERM P-1141 / JCM 9156 / N-4) TaxID=649639 RepID=E6TRH1_EVAC2|nr:type VII secretion protein EssC [Evansella cellulosilytica]ADU31801.1 FHA domain containing protein [Evansella cellulosilytica DSM 2522]
MILTLFANGKAVTTVLPERITGKYILSTDDKDIMAIEAQDGQWFLKSNKHAFLKDTHAQVIISQVIEPFQTYSIFQDDGSVALLYVEPQTSGLNEYTRHHVMKKTIRIGRSKESQICFSNKLVSSVHCVIEYDVNGHTVIKDNNSSNGTYVNGKKVTEAQLEIGDVIYIMGLKIIYNGRLLSLNNPHDLVLLDRHALKPFISEKPIMEEEDPLDDFRTDESDPNLFYRSPRFKRDIEKREIKIDPPPQKNNTEETPLMLMLGPSITMGMASLTMGIFVLQRALSSDGNMMYAIPTLIMSFSMIIGMVLWPILTKKYEKKKRIKNEKKRQEKYKQYLEEMKEVIIEEGRHQSEILHENHVPLPILLDRVKKRKRNLWERVIGQNDFLKVRLGIGDLPLEADIKYPEKKFTLDDDNLQEELYEIVEAPQILKKVPVTLGLMEEQVSGIIGPRNEVKDFVKGLILQLATLHSYDELKLVLIYDEKEQEDWAFAKWLPHVWDEGKVIRFIAANANELKELSAYFEKEIKYQSELSEQDLADVNQHYVVFSMSKSLASKAEMFNLLLKEKKSIGFSLVTLYDDLALLPKECSKVVELGKNYSKIYDKDDITGQYTAFNADIFYRDNPENLSVKLANIQLATSLEEYSLPDMLTFLEMFGVSKIEHLNSLTRWKENNPTLTIETPIGVNRMGESFNIDLHEKYHGPHGLIAGMTGSGKSEFIMTFILSLAVNYHPDEVAFILIDYKGGGMANAFLNLPHLAGTITNLDGAAVKRSLISIQSELKRRQSLFSKASREMNESNIDIYKYQKLYREGLVKEPLQHLFMISDEFAELKTQQPEFMDQLVSAARIGRSLGVHLILATQKPSGVVDDQIWSNSKFRISLKVQEKADSMEVIKRPDAAELSTTGRFYLQVGYNELFELGQSAWAGAPYYPAEKVEKSEDNSISIIDNLGRVITSAKIDKQKSSVKNPPKQIDEVTKYLETLAKQENIKVKPLWLEPIPALIYLDSIREKYRKVPEKFRLNPIIGEYDDPANQNQLLMRMPISDEGNAVIYGVAGSGKTTFIASIIYSLMEEHTPEEVQFYLLDFSSESLTWYRNAPHVGDVVLSHEAEKISNLFKMLNSEIDNRRKVFANFGGDFVTYNQVSEKTIPSIIAVIHNYAAFSEMYEEHEETISFLTREGLRYGIYFILTAANTSAVRFRLLQNFKQMYVLQLNDTSDYSGVLGNVDGVYPSKHKGRGIFKSDATYEFQVAHITEGIEDMYTYIIDYCERKQEVWGKSSAKRIPVLPEKVDTQYLQEEIKYSNVAKLPIGVEKVSMGVAYYDFTSSFVNIVLSASNEDYASFMEGITEILSEAEESEVIVIDPNENIQVNKDQCKYVSEREEVEEMIISLFETLVYRNNTKKDALEQGKESPHFEQMTCVIDTFTDLSTVLSEDANDKLKVFLDKGDSLNVNIIISDSADKLNSIAFESWFQKQVSLGDAIWIGNGIAEQFLLKISKVSNDMYKEIPQDFGYVVTKGKVKLVKLLTSSNRQKEAMSYG